MTEHETKHHRLKPLRIVCVVFGGAIMFAGIAADKLGFGQPGSFGIGQLLLAWMGLLMVFIGSLGQRVVSLYRGAAIILLNTLVLLAALELGAIVVARSGILPSYRQGVFEMYLDLPYYAAQDWAEAYWREATQAERFRYQSYLVWRHRPFEGEMIHIDREGIRRTPGADCSSDSYKVFVFGGSTMWGWGSPDWATITAYLQMGLGEHTDQSVCVVNLAEDGFVSTQSVIALAVQLQSGHVPDLVIFYDGVNDVYAAYESGEPGVHVTLAQVAAKFEEREHPLLKWFMASRQFTLLERLVGTLTSDGLKHDATHTDVELQTRTDILAGSIIETYLSNYRIVGALAREYGFEYAFFWQPHIGVDEKPPTTEEQIIRSTLDPELLSLVRAVYERIPTSVHDFENLWDISDVFGEQDDQIWIDGWGHVTPEGNRLVAVEMLAVIQEQLADR